MPDSGELRPNGVRTDDWPVQATDAIVKTVGTVSDKITGPIRTVARAIVFGTFAAILGITALVLFCVVAIRVADDYLPNSVFGKEHVWVAYIALGVLFSAVAVVLYAKRTPRASTA